MDISVVVAIVLALVAAWLAWRNHETAMARDAALKARDLALAERDAASKEREKAVLDFAVANERTRLLEGAEQRARQSEDDADKARLELEGERARSAERAKAAEESKQALAALKTEFEATFKALAADALQGSQKQFMNVAAEMFEQRKVQQDETLKTILDPVKETFAQFKEKVEVIEKARLEDRSVLTEQIRAVGETMAATQAQTGKLVNALRSAPKTRGRWGEETLRNVLELSGLSQYDFKEQKNVSTDENRLMPDVVVRLPGDREIVIDSKVALAGYFDAMDCPEEEREAHLAKHVAQIRTHIKQLGSKEYWKALPSSVDLVVMFVPGENFFAAAAERDPDLFQYAIKQKVVVVTPGSLMAMLKAVSYGWRQEQVGRDAQKIADLGRELFTRMSVLADKTIRVGNALDGGVKAYNELVATLETRVLPQARKFEEFGAGDPGGKLLSEVAPLDSAARQLALERFDSAGDIKAAPPESAEARGKGAKQRLL